MCIRDRPEAVDGYVFKQPSQDRGFPLAELTEQQHRTALENGFGKQVIYGYENVLKLSLIHILSVKIQYISCVPSPISLYRAARNKSTNFSSKNS